MRYALNVVPINGWEQHNGSGTAAMVMTTTDGPALAGLARLGAGSAQQVMTLAGEGRLIMKGQAQPAPMVMSSAGNGVLARLGAGRADAIMSATGVPSIRMFGVSGPAAMIMSLNGDGVIIPSLGGRVEMIMSASGDMKLVIQGRGRASMAMQAAGDGRPRPPVLGSGIAYTQLGAWGAGNLVMQAAGNIAMRMSLSDTATRLPVTHHGSGRADMLMIVRGDAGGWREITGSGAAEMVLLGKMIVPRPAIPTEFVGAPDLRRFTVPGASRVLVVPQESAARRF